jgi:UDP-N-acetylmuramyl pentapeptide synthase
MSTARPADLTTTRDLLCAMLSKSDRVLLSAGNVQGAIGIDSKALRCLEPDLKVSVVFQ